jgi:hypothetical protein
MFYLQARTEICFFFWFALFFFTQSVLLSAVECAKTPKIMNFHFTSKNLVCLVFFSFVSFSFSGFECELPIMEKPCGNVIRQMLRHLHAFEVRTGHRYNDNSAAQSEQEFYHAANRLMNVCPDEPALKERVAKVLAKNQCNTKPNPDLSTCNTKALYNASADLQEVLIPCRPRLEQMHWRAAFKWPKLISGPD